jgi:hypothetical protein
MAGVVLLEVVGAGGVAGADAIKALPKMALIVAGGKPTSGAAAAAAAAEIGFPGLRVSPRLPL